jgi:hypothetical protein
MTSAAQTAPFLKILTAYIQKRPKAKECLKLNKNKNNVVQNKLYVGEFDLAPFSDMPDVVLSS